MATAPTRSYSQTIVPAALLVIFASGHGVNSAVAANNTPLTFQDGKATVATEGSPALSGQSDAAEPWRFQLTPYFWLAGMSGDLTVRNHSTSVDQDLGDVVDVLKDHLNFGAALHFEAEHGRAGLFVDAMYMDLRGERDRASGGKTIDAQLEQFIGELGGFYTLIPAKPVQEGPLTFRLDALGGLRTTWMQLEIDPDATSPVTRDRGWVDPIVGLRTEVGITDWLSARVRGDIGGFGLGSGTTSEFAWNVDAGLAFHLSSSAEFLLGYRWLDYDYEDGAGSDKFIFDMQLSGPYMGLTFRF